MSAGHTHGRLLAGVSLHEGRSVFSAVSRENTRKIVAMTGYCGAADENESIANTRRLVAAWNYAEMLGMSTEELEIAAAPQAQQPAGEPVAEVVYLERGGNAGIATRIVEIDSPHRDRLQAGTKLYAAPQAQLAVKPAVNERAQFNAAIDFAIQQGIEAGVFLNAWRHGDTSEWPEFQPPQTQQPVQNTKAEGGAA